VAHTPSEKWRTWADRSNEIRLVAASRAYNPGRSRRLFWRAIFEIAVTGHRSILGRSIQMQDKLVISSEHMRTNRETLFVLEYFDDFSID
jgi:hypothetical protein